MQTDLVQESYIRLFQTDSFPYSATITYSGRFRGYNGGVKKMGFNLEFSISKNWKDVDSEIQIGLIQHLLCKILKKKAKTQNMDLYSYFIKSLHLSAPKTQTEPELAASFERVISLMELFDIEKPNLSWGSATFRKLASYSYEDDTVRVSSLFQDAPTELLDYLMYHELLHKKFKFVQKESKSMHHTREFLEWEAKFPRRNAIEKELTNWVKNKRVPKKRFIWNW